MATDLISPQEVRLPLALRKEPERWVTNNALADAVQCSPRTARLHTDRLVKLGLLDRQPLSPAPVFRLKDEISEEALAYLGRVEKAREALGL